MSSKSFFVRVAASSFRQVTQSSSATMDGNDGPLAERGRSNERKEKTMDHNRSEAGTFPNGREQTLADKARERTSRTVPTTAVLKEIFWGVLYAVGGYLLGGCSLPFGTYPFGVAWLCAAERRVPYLFVGLCLSVIGLSHPILRVLAYVLALLIRVAVRLTIDQPQEGRTLWKERRWGELWASLFLEQTGLRMMTACLSVFLVGVYRLIEGGFLYYDLYGALLGLVVSPVAVLLFVGANRPYDGARSYVRAVGMLSLACLLVYASRELRFAYVSVSAFGAMLMTLYMTKREGLTVGMIAGALCGVAYLPIQAPLFVFGAIVSGLLSPVSGTLSTMITVVVGSAWALYTRGLGALSGLLPAILVASVLFFVIDKLFLVERSEVAEASAAEQAACVSCQALDASAMDGVRLSETARQIKTVCESFASMAEMFEAMGKAMQRPTTEQLRGICDRAFASSCASCQEKENCWEACYRQTDAEIGNLAATLYREGRVDGTQVDETLSARCTRLPDILDEINHNAELHAARILQSDKTEIFAMDYAAMADILAETMTGKEEEYVADTALAEQLAEHMTVLDKEITSVLAWGTSRRHVAVRSRVSLDEAQREAIAALLLEQTACHMVVEASEEREDGSYETVFAERERLSLSVVRRVLRADGEEKYCGDSVGVFERENMQYAFVSDGMGAGREAALASGICALFLQKMIGAGNRCETVLRMLNGFLRNKGASSLHECSATVDLMALDRISGYATFYKCGAAPTYVLRDGSLFKIRSKTLPIGILKELDHKKVRFEIHAGDVIVMVSDGVTQGKEECPWLFDLLRRNVELHGIEKTADLVVQYAKREGSADDLSVLILKVEER